MAEAHKSWGWLRVVLAMTQAGDGPAPAFQAHRRMQNLGACLRDIGLCFAVADRTMRTTLKACGLGRGVV